ncbi:MAG: MFS transporter [Epsilonproteobacteria bacterium]|nr:MFS transporter [Campylobacterota bacterium]
MPFLLATFYFFYFAIIGVYIIFMPKVLYMVGYGASDIGILFSASPLVRFLLPFLFIKGLRLDHKTFNSALLILFVSAIAFAFSIHNFWLLFAANIGVGVGLSLVLPYVETIALASIGKERYGKVRLFGSVGFVLVALVLVKFLSEAMVAIYYLLGMTFFTIITALFISNSMRKNRTIESGGGLPILRDWRLWLGLTLMQVSFGAYYNFFTIYETQRGLSMDMTIYLWSFGVLAEIVMLYYQAAFLRRNLLAVLQVAIAATAIRWLILFAAPQNLTLLFMAQSIHALSFALFHSASIALLFMLYEQKALAQQFFSGITYGFGGLIGALASGYIYEFYPDELFLFSASIALAGLLYLSRYAKEAQKRAA